ncbi:TPA: hypothetical protein ACWP80_001529 [Enterococcus faecium]
MKKIISKSLWQSLLFGILGGVIVFLVMGIKYSLKGSLVDWLSAIGTLGAVTVSLWLAQRNQKAHIDFVLDYDPFVDTFNLKFLNNGEKSLFVKVLNYQLKGHDKNDITDKCFESIKFETAKIIPGDIVSMIGIDHSQIRRLDGNWIAGEVWFEVIGVQVNKVMLINNEGHWEIERVEAISTK